MPQGPKRNSGMLDTRVNVTTQIVRQVSTQIISEFICTKKSLLLLMVLAVCRSILALFRPSIAKFVSSCPALVVVFEAIFKRTEKEK
jgi:hypothetical protein